MTKLDGQLKTVDQMYAETLSLIEDLKRFKVNTNQRVVSPETVKLIDRKIFMLEFRKKLLETHLL